MAHQRLSIFPSAIESVIRLIGSLGDDVFAGLVAEIRSSDAFDVGDRRTARMAERLGVAPDDARAIVGTLGYLYGQIHRRAASDVTDADVAAALRRDLLSEAGEDAAEIPRLVLLLQRDPLIDESRALARLRAGFTPRATSFVSTVDLRPDVAEGGAVVRRLAPIVQFRISTDAPGERPSTLLFQVEPRALDDLEEAIRAARERLAAIRATPELAKIIVE